MTWDCFLSGFAGVLAGALVTKAVLLVVAPPREAVLPPPRKMFRTYTAEKEPE